MASPLLDYDALTRALPRKIRGPHETASEAALSRMKRIQIDHRKSRAVAYRHQQTVAEPRKPHRNALDQQEKVSISMKGGSHAARLRVISLRG